MILIVLQYYAFLKLHEKFVADNIWFFVIFHWK